VDDINFQLEALREAKNWSTWMFGIGSACPGVFAVFKETVEDRHRFDAKMVVICSSASFAAAISEVDPIDWTAGGRS
jgi:hypothetical protein